MDNGAGAAGTVRRPRALARVLDAARDFLADRVEAGTAPGDAARRIFDALAGSAGVIAPGRAPPPPAYRYLPSALDRARAAPGVSSLADAFAALDPELTWVWRTDSEEHGETFRDGHANAWLVGPAGLEQRSDVLVGASLLAPGIRYIDHRHPPEEIYIVMSEGEWYREDRGWHMPGIGGVVHNPSDAVHAMRAGPRAAARPVAPPGGLAAIFHRCSSRGRQDACGSGPHGPKDAEGVADTTSKRLEGVRTANASRLASAAEHR